MINPINKLRFWYMYAFEYFHTCTIVPYNTNISMDSQVSIKMLPGYLSYMGKCTNVSPTISHHLLHLWKLLQPSIENHHHPSRTTSTIHREPPSSIQNYRYHQWEPSISIESHHDKSTTTTIIRNKKSIKGTREK